MLSSIYKFGGLKLMRTLRCIALTLVILLASCSQANESPPFPQATELQEKKWVLLVVDGMSRLPGTANPMNGFTNLTSTLEPDRFYGYDGCNMFVGRYTATATTLDIGKPGAPLGAVAPRYQLRRRRTFTLLDRSLATVLKTSTSSCRTLGGVRGSSLQKQMTGTG